MAKIGDRRLIKGVEYQIGDPTCVGCAFQFNSLNFSDCKEKYECNNISFIKVEKMSNKLVIPARLEKAAKELVNNMTILKGCSPEVKEVVAMAVKQNCLTCYHKGDGIKGDGGYVIGNDLAIAYCLPDDIKIVVQEESKVPQWIKDRYTVCEIKNFSNARFTIFLPNGSSFEPYGLPAALRCEEWVFWGWVAEGISHLLESPCGFTEKDGAICGFLSEGCLQEYKPVKIIASAWQKVEK